MNKNFNPYKSKSNNASKRMIAFVIAIVIWAVSITFNVDGFNIRVPERLWMAIALGIAVTGIQLVGNSSNPKENWTIFLLCLLSYAYAISTDVTGIARVTKTDSYWVWIFATIIEIAPEPLLIWAINPGNREGDFLWKLFRTLFPPSETPMPVKPRFTPPGVPVKPIYNTPLNQQEMMRQKVRQENFKRMQYNDSGDV